MNDSRSPKTPVGRYLAVRITAIYAIVGGLWILLSDFVLGLAVSPEAFSRLSILKGWIFILITSILLHSLIRSGLNALRQSESVLLDSERRLSDIIAFLPDATVAIDCEGRVIAWNRAMEELSGVPSHQMLGKGNYEYAVPFYGIRRPVLIDLVLNPGLEIAHSYEVLEHENDALVAEVCIPDFRSGGAYIWVKASPLRDSQGNLIGAIAALRDVTERKRHEEEQRRNAERERQIESEAEEAKRQFYRRTIFSVTEGKLNLADHAEVDGLMAHLAERIELTKHGGLSEARERVVKLGQEIGMSPERVHSLVTAMGEAAANAVKHAEGGTITICAKDRSLLVCVRDHGGGMDQLVLPKATLLTRFSTKTSMGLGYSLILGLVDRVHLATDAQGTSVLMEQGVEEPESEISLSTLPDTW